MAKLIKGYYKDGVWHEYGGKLYDTIGYNTNGSMTQKAITENIGELVSLINGYRLAIRVIGDASVSNLDPFYFKSNGESFYIELTYNAGYALNVISIIMDGTDITQEAYQDGVISIDRVTGNVVITVETASVTDTNMFTRRTTGNGISILNNKALLKWVRGNTILWNQYRPNNISSFQTLGTFTLENVDDTIVMSGWGSVSGSTTTFAFSFGVSGNTGDKILICCKAYADTDTTQSKASFGIGLTANPSNSIGSHYSDKRDKNKWIVLDRIETYDQSSAKNCMFAVYNPTYASVKWLTSNTTVKVKDLCCVNLTSLFGKGNEPTIAKFKELFYNDLYNYSTNVVLNNSMTNYISKDGNEETLQNVSLNVPTLTGKLNGDGESVVVFPNGMKSSCNEAVNDTYDEIKQVDGVWKAYKRVGDTRATNAISGRGEYEILAQEEVYILDDQTIPTEITVANQGVEEIKSVPYDAEVEYLQSNGNQYIDSGIECTGDLKVHFNGSVLSQVNSGACGGIHTTSPYFRHHWSPYMSSLFYWIQKDTSGQSSIEFDSSVDTFYEVIVDPVNGTGSINGTTKTFTALQASYTTGQNYFIFARKASDGDIQSRACRFKFFKMYKNGVLLRDFIPVRKDGVGYMYDKVSGQLFGNAGTDNFTYGNDVPITPTTAPAIMEIQYGAIPSIGLLGGLLGGTKGGGSDEPDYSDGEEITDYEEEQEPNEEEPLEEPLDEEQKEDIKESPVIGEKQELKK